MVELIQLSPTEFELMSGRVGETTLKGKTGTMKNWRYADGADYMFPEDEVRAARKA